MTIVDPIIVDDDAYIGGNLTENDTDDAPEWADSTMYDRGDYVRIDSAHAIYQCLTDHESADGTNDPLTEAAALADPVAEDPNPQHWVYVSQTNKWRIFDQRPSQRTENALTISAYVQVPSRASAVAILNISDCVCVTIEVYEGAQDGDRIFRRIWDLNETDSVVDWFTYFYEPHRLQTDFLFADFPIISTDDVVYVELAGGDDLACGQIVLGYGSEIGLTQAGNTGFEGLDFSHVETNIYGDLVTVERAATDIHRFDVQLQNNETGRFASRVRAFKGGKRALWIGEDTEGLRAWQYGFYRDYQVYYNDGVFSRAELTVQGVV